MSTAKKPTFIKGTIKGTAKYPRLNTPDTKFNANGVFSVKLILTQEDATPLMEAVDGVMNKGYDEKLAQMKADGKSPALIKKVKLSDTPYQEVYDEEGNPTGEFEVTFKMNHKITKKDGTVETRKPKLFDAQGAEIKGVAPSIWGGSVLTVAYQLIPFDSPVAGVGCSMRLQAVQINTLVSGTGGTAESYGFGKDGDYEAAVAEDDASDFDAATSTTVDGATQDDF